MIVITLNKYTVKVKVIFLFCLFFALIANVQNVAKTAETTVGITVFFDEDMPEDQILAAGDVIRGWEEVR